jgi:hypothetical protein
MEFSESLVCAHHNYLVNNRLTPGFYLGDPNRSDDFFFLADFVPSGDFSSRISGRFYDIDGNFLLAMERNQVLENPASCHFQTTPDGFRLTYPAGELLLETRSQHFSNGFLTHISGKLFDSKGGLIMEPSYEGIQVYGEASLVLDKPFEKGR